MNISCFLIKPWQEKILKEKLRGHNLKIFSQPLNSENLEETKDSEIIVSRARLLDLKFNRETLEKFPNLKMIATMSTGFDHIDIDYCKEKNILVLNVPDYGENTVAEQTFALILAISKKIPASIESVKNHSFSQKELEGFDLNGKTLGVIGSGKIGVNVIKIAKSFGMEVIAYDIIHNTEACNELGYCYVNLEDLLKRADIITIHVPFNKHTHHLLNKDNLSLLKKDAIVINTARGELIDTFALIDCLKNKKIGFAGLDVFEGESDPECQELQELIKLNNVFITPHNASNTREAKKRIFETTVENVLSFINQNPKNLVY